MVSGADIYVLEPLGAFPSIENKNLCSSEGSWLTFESKDALYVSCEATLGLLLHLVFQRWESNMIKGQVKEQRFAWDGLEARREVHEADLLADKRRIQTEGLKPF